MAILYSFYGDDFTGSTDVLQQLSSKGVPSVLFLRIPSARDLARFPDAVAVGLAGDSRSRSPEWMTEHLPTVFRWMRTLGAPVNHYKVCSTFDSSPQTGSIGRAIELGMEAFPETACVPVMVAAPHLRRYVCFGQLFASAPDGEILRIDQHPMSRHPVTPMREADLRRHLALQTSLPIASVELPELAAGNEASRRMNTNGIVVFDGVDERTQAVSGGWIWRMAQTAPLFTAASSGLTAALVSAWQAADVVPATCCIATLSQEAREYPLLVISGSCSVATGRQIEWAVANGFQGIALDPSALVGDGAVEELVRSTVASLRAGRPTVVYTALGAATADGPAGDVLGRTLGRLTQELIREIPLRRVLLCGGDTCSHAVQQMPIDALTWLADACPGAPLCHAHSAENGFDGLQLVLKGGQVGTEDFFATVARLGNAE